MSVSIRGLGHAYAELQTIDRLDLEVPDRTVVGLVGPSGCGKSTLLELICGLLEPSAGTVEVGGAAAAPERLGQCAFMPQRDLLLPWYSALDNAALALRNRGRGRAEARAAASELFERFGLAGFERARPSELSGGMRQRVAFLRTLVAGKPVYFKSPHESRDVGIEMIYQDFALCGNMDVGQNIFLGRWPKRGPFVNRRKMYTEADAVLKRLKVDVNSVYQRVESLSGGRQQSVAIARAISFEPRVVILDEPTANLSVMATERLLETMVELKKHGVAQIIISHRLQDIFAVGDRVMVLKRGENVGDRYIAKTTETEVLALIVSGTRATALTADEAAAAGGVPA